LAARGKVSIIIPVYNSARHLEKCLNSVVKQTYDDIEIIIVNDGSTDDSKKICESFKSTYKNIKLINQENSGQATARNKGIQVSTGENIQFVDSDDTIDFDMTQKLVNSINDEIQLVICGYRKIQADKIIDNFPGIYGTKDIKDFLNIFCVYFENLVINSSCNKLYVSEVIKKNALNFDPDIRLGEDFFFNLQYIQKCKKICVIKDVLYNYMAVGYESITRRYKKDMFLIKKMIFENMKKFLEENDSYNEQNQKILEYTYLKTLIACFENIINPQNSLKAAERINEIKKIINDESVNIIRNINDEKIEFQNKIVRFMIMRKLSFGIFVFFSVKGLLRRRTN